MLELALAMKKIGLKVDQVQDFTPTPGTISSCMFHTGIDPLTGKQVYVARSDREKGLQKALLLWHQPGERAEIMEALKEMGRLNDAELLLGERSKTCVTGRTAVSAPCRKSGAAHTKKAR